MDQAIVWLQFVLWATFLMGSIGCALSVRDVWGTRYHYHVVAQEVFAWVMLLVMSVVLHHVIELALEV